LTTILVWTILDVTEQIIGGEKWIIILHAAVRPCLKRARPGPATTKYSVTAARNAEEPQLKKEKEKEMNNLEGKINRALAMKEYFSKDELDIIHYALSKYYEEELKGNFTGYTIATQTLKLKEIFARQ
jgi:hypothetical protein